MSINKLDALLNQLTSVHGHHSEAEFITGFVKKHRELKDIGEEDLYQQCVNHIVSCSMQEQKNKIRMFNEQISTGITGLANLKEWGNIDAIAKHALAAEYSVLEELTNSGDKLAGHILSRHGFVMNIANAGYDNIPEVITEHYAAKGIIVTFTTKE